MKRRVSQFALLLAIAAVGLPACNTVQGLGKDTEKVGEKIQKEAGRHTDDDDSALRRHHHSSARTGTSG